jgi:hypothetical protein
LLDGARWARVVETLRPPVLAGAFALAFPSLVGLPLLLLAAFAVASVLGFLRLDAKPGIAPPTDDRAPA